MSKKYVFYYKIMNGTKVFEEKYEPESSPEEIKTRVLRMMQSIEYTKKQFPDFEKLKIKEMTVFQKHHSFDLKEVLDIVSQPVQLELEAPRPNPFAWLAELVEKEKQSNSETK